MPLSVESRIHAPTVGHEPTPTQRVKRHQSYYANPLSLRIPTSLNVCKFSHDVFKPISAKSQNKNAHDGNYRLNS